MKYYKHPEIGPWILRRTNTRSLRAVYNKLGVLEIRAPKRIPFRGIIAFLEANLSWIKSHKVESMIFKSGDRVINHQIIQGSTEPNKLVVLRDDRIIVSGELDFDEVQTQQLIHKIAARVVTDESKKYLLQRAEDLSKKHKLRPEFLRVRAMNSRWGSCSSKKRISLSSYLIFLPEDLIDYVIRHELAHLKQLNHSDKFWRQLADLDQNYSAKTKRLKRLRPQLKLNTTPNLLGDVQ